jgi:threonylcarbamoyladenosine tRNA methylthiotransferase MtaB
MRKDARIVFFMTIGCRLNQADSALMADRLHNAGYTVADSENGNPEVIIMNTCSVTGTAARKSRQALRQMRRKNPDACIIVTGCSADIEKDFWENESSADIVIVNEGKKKILEYLDAFFNKTSLSNINIKASDDVFKEDASAYFPFKSRAFLKIQEGCNSFCSYCIVPYTRGKENSFRL